MRLSLLKFNQPAIDNLPFSTYPIPGTDYRPFKLSADGTLLASSAKAGVAKFEGTMTDRSGEVHFILKFDQKSRLAGYAKAILYMSCDDHDDFDVFVQLRKADGNGRLLESYNIPHADMIANGAPPDPDMLPKINVLVHKGPKGVLRASHREVSLDQGPDYEVFHPHTKAMPISPGTVAKLEIGFWPMGIEFDSGESLVLVVSGTDVSLPEFPGV